MLLVGFYCMYVGLSVRAAGAVLENADDAVFWAIGTWMPVWMKPVYLIAILAAAFSTADSALNAASTNIANDTYKNIYRPNADDKQIVRVAKIGTVVLGAVCVGLALRTISMLVLIFKGAQVAIVGGVFWPILLGMFWKGATKSACRITTPVGALVGIVFEFTPGLKDLMGGGAIPGIIAAFVLMVGISLMTRDKCGGTFHRVSKQVQNSETSV